MNMPQLPKLEEACLEEIRKYSNTIKIKLKLQLKLELFEN